MKEQVLEVIIRLGDGEQADAGQRALAARLLRDMADRVERGDPYGGFHFGVTDSTEGGWVMRTKEKGAPLNWVFAT